jgi:hypothetical protein
LNAWREAYRKGQSADETTASDIDEYETNGGAAAIRRSAR